MRLVRVLVVGGGGAAVRGGESAGVRAGRRTRRGRRWSWALPQQHADTARLGVADSVTRRGAPINEWLMLAPGGAVMSQQVAGRDRPISSLGIYRPDLVAELAAGLPRGALHTGHRCVAFSQDDRYAVVTFDNGVSVEADVVIAADGIRSADA